MATHERLELIVKWNDEENEKASDKRETLMNVKKWKLSDWISPKFPFLTFTNRMKMSEHKKAFKFRIDKELRGLIERSRLSIENF